MTQGDLFADGPEHLDLADADVTVIRGALAPEVTGPVLAALLDQVEWRTDSLRMFGREVPIPRLHAWYGDPDAEYTYSGLLLVPEAWIPPLLALRTVAEHFAGAEFDSVLCNRYRDGADGQGWHADDEPELGPEPVIASISLGATRTFALRRRDDHGERVDVVLGDGDVLVMRGRTQACWQHAVPKTRRPVGERVNCTFRRIVR